MPLINIGDSQRKSNAKLGYSQIDLEIVHNLTIPEVHFVEYCINSFQTTTFLQSPASMGDKHAANQPSNFDLLKSTLEKMNKVVGSEEEDDEKEGDVDDDDEWS